MTTTRPSFDLRAELAELDAYIAGVPEYLAKTGYLEPYVERASFLREALLLAESVEHSLRLHAPIHVMRVRRRWADTFVVPIDFLGALCRFWSNLAVSALALLRQADPNLEEAGSEAFLALPASPASYSLGLAVQHPSSPGIYDLIARALKTGPNMEGLQREFGGDVSLDRTAYRGLLALLSESGVDLEVRYLERASTDFSDVYSVTHDQAGETCTLLASTEEAESDRVIQGHLVGASLLRGKIEIKTGSGKARSASVADTSQIRGLRIGQRYSFQVREIRVRDVVSGRVTISEQIVEVAPPIVSDDHTESAPELEEELFPSDRVPEGNDLKKVHALLQRLALHLPLTPDSIGLRTDRWVLYYRHSARVLGYLTESGSLTRLGARVASMRYEDFLKQTALQFEVSDVGDAWMRWAGVSSLVELGREQALPFVQERVSGLSGTNIDRRAGTLRSWLKKLKPFHFSSPPPTSAEKKPKRDSRGGGEG